MPAGALLPVGFVSQSVFRNASRNGGASHRKVSDVSKIYFVWQVWHFERVVFCWCSSRCVFGLRFGSGGVMLGYIFGGGVFGQWCCGDDSVLVF